MPDPQAINQLREKLLNRKNELLDRLQMNAETWKELHERQIELEEQAANESLAAGFAGLEEQAVLELARIEKALRKIKEERYGICESCGRPIKVNRLQAMPDAERCLRCASRSDTLSGSGEGKTVEEEEDVLPVDWSGLDDEQMALEIMEFIRSDGSVPTEELEVSCSDGVVQLFGYLPSEHSRQLLLQTLTDSLGLPEIEDHLDIDPLLWENRE